MEKELNQRPGYTLDGEGEYIIRHIDGEQIEGLQDSTDLAIEGVTMEGLSNFVSSRAEYIKERKGESLLKANTRASTLSLVIGEHGRRKLIGQSNAVCVTRVSAASKETEDYVAVKGFMRTRRADMKVLAREFRAAPHLFANMDEMAAVVKVLRDTSFKVEVVRTSTDNEDTKKKEESMVAQLVGESADFEFRFKVPFYEGQGRTEIPVRVLLEISDGDKSKVEAVLYDATPEGLKIMERKAQRDLLDGAIADIEESLGKGTIPIVFHD